MDLAEPPGLTFAEIRAGAAPVSGVGDSHLRWILVSEIVAGRVIEKDGYYSLAEGWDRRLLQALRELHDDAAG